ncbi:hypothetical protein DPMN_111824 [Dreissena polymorpha]|uniref:Uncharacterized protein n=1 Tax=Dreissena polymorpha TaxID=45954 RepID=A0A9D4KEJ2_DREPO|nr:hypothetical protein DPMN_111824 [Dreissena polymorpha]
MRKCEEILLFGKLDLVNVEVDTFTCLEMEPIPSKSGCSLHTGTIYISHSNILCTIRLFHPDDML